MRVIIKGGVWKNTEDEILKAAVMKYGKNQWARISSLLVRKTPKQCKARWYEWLDPSIKKTDWSKEEDEKLLHLAKLMPTQWRTIAPIVGRTSAQCLERYQRLLDEAESSAAGLDLTTASTEAAPSADDIRRLRPGEIDPDPESKPARPDPVDMDEDEKEMLSEARARLANTQGKKAKRKAREKQLEEARRLAAIQKRRELKAAGIEVHEKKVKKGMDYNADVPFERKPLPGAYDTREEIKKEFLDPNFTKLQLQNVEPKKRHEIQEEKQKEYNKKQKLLKEKQKEGIIPSAHLEQLAQQKFTANRRKLVLPAPQVGESELEEIVKMGMDSDSALALVQDEGSSITQGLLSEYRQTPSFSSQLRTPRTQTTVDAVLQEAQNQLAMTNAQTPLLGGENDGLDRMGTGTGFEGATPRKTVTSTPHPMLKDSNHLSTPGFKQPASVLRDDFGINNSVAATPLSEEKLLMSHLKQQLALGLAKLPAPKNDFVLVIPEEEEEEVEDAPLNEEDAAERDRRIQEQLEEEERTLFRQRSQVLKLGLPRPVEFDSAAYLAASVENSVYFKDEQPALFWADKLVQEELIRLLQYETEVYPPPADLVAALKAKRKTNAKFDLSSYHELDEDALAEARDLIEEETQKRNLSTESIEALVEPMVASNLASFRSAKVVFEENRATVLKLAAKAKKREKRLGVLLGGYMARAKAHSKALRDAFDHLDEARIEYESLFALHQLEHASGQIRLEKLTKEVEALKKKEQDGQSRYAELSQVKYHLMQKVYPTHSNPITDGA